jgi:hypothetical protein
MEYSARRGRTTKRDFYYINIFQRVGQDGILRAVVNRARASGPSNANKLARKWESRMLAGAIVAILLIFGLFLSMLSSSPRADAEYHPDTEQ